VANLFDRLKAPANFKELYGSLPELRNPQKDDEIRLHAEWVLDGVPMVRTSTNGFYIVGAELYSLLVGRMMMCDFHAAITSGGSVFVWPVRRDMPSTEAKEAADAAAKGWVKVVWDQDTKKYKVEPASKDHGEPKWPFADFDKLLEVTVADRILDDPNSEVVQKVLAKKRKGKK
jgi:hypothetical protein